MGIETIDRHFYMALGQKLNDIRIRRGKTYREMAEDTGMSRTTIDNFFLGKSRATNRKFELICQSLGIEKEMILEKTLNL